MTRRRYRYNPETKAMEELGADWTDVERRAPTATEELTYGGMRATDGTPIDTKKKHRDYLKQHGYAMASDYTETWARAKAEREAAPNRVDRELRDTIGRTIYNLEKSGRSRRR